MQQTIRIDSSKLQTQIANIGEIARHNKWRYHYNSQLDTLSFSPLSIKKPFTLVSIGKEMSIYVDKKSNLGGVFIEYYKSNLTEHDKRFKSFKNIFTQKIDSEKTIPTAKKEKALILSELIKAELLSQLTIENSSTIQLQF